MKRRDAVIEEYKNRHIPAFARKDIFVARQWMYDLRREPLVELRSALLRVQVHFALANTSGLEDVLGRGSEVPSDGTSLSLMSAQMCGPGTRAGRVASDSADRLRLSRAPNMKYKYLLGSGARPTDRTSEYFRPVA